MCSTAIPSFPIQQAIHGFPTVHKLQKVQVSSLVLLPIFSLQLFILQLFFQGQKVEDANKKKSLFAQQFESSGLERFGLVARTPKLPSIATSQVERDRVDPPVSLSVRERKEEERVADMESSPVDQSVDMADLETTGEGSAIHTLLTVIQKLDNYHIHSLTHSERHGSASAATWDRFLFHPTLVSDQGLVTSGITKETARQEVEHIHEENLKKLSTMSHEEISQEQEKIRNLLGWFGNV